MKLIFIIIAVAYLLLFLVRWLLSLIYYKKGKSDVTDFPEELFTVVQPILPVTSLKSDLEPICSKQKQ
ncbi:MAG: hypothetical protein ACLS4H_09675 [Streptococcus salivarius]